MIGPTSNSGAQERAGFIRIHPFGDCDDCFCSQLDKFSVSTINREAIDDEVRASDEVCPSTKGRQLWCTIQKAWRRKVVGIIRLTFRQETQVWSCPPCHPPPTMSPTLKRCSPIPGPISTIFPTMEFSWIRTFCQSENLDCSMESFQLALLPQVKFGHKVGFGK